MVFIVETGSGTPGANALADPAFVTQYLTERNRVEENDWSNADPAVQQAACIAGTDYIETVWGLRLKGSKLNQLIDGRNASGALTFSGVPANNETVTIGLKVYRFVNTLAQENDVLIGGTIAECIANLVGAVNLTGELGITMHFATMPNYEAIAEDASPILAVFALTTGESGNLIAFEETVTNATITGTGFLEDGLDEAEQPLSFPRRWLYTRDGRPVIGVPLKAKQAMAEYSVRALAAALSPDPVVDDSLIPVSEKSEKVGPIEESVKYMIGGRPVVLRPYPAADRLLAEYVTAGGGVIRG